jgi:hypothetical protein
MPDTTTRYGLPFQEPGDAPDGPLLGEDLADAVEAAIGGVDDRLEAAEDAALTGTAWANVAVFGGNWGNFGGTTWQVARYRKTAYNVVELEGMLLTSTAANGNTIFTLPVGFRPVRSHLLQASWNPNAGGCRLILSPTGTLAIYALDVSGIGAGQWVNLAGITFVAEQ